MRPRASLALRLALLTALWVAGGLTVVGWFVSGLVIRQVEAAFDARTAGLLDAVAAATGLDPEGRPRLARPLPDPELERPLSGRYWQLAGPDGTVIRSRSLWDERLPPPREGAPPGEAVASDIAGPRGEPLRLVQRDVVPLRATAPVHVQVAVARAPVDAEIARLRRRLALAFGLLGIGLVAVVAAQVVLGMAPLRRLRQALAEVRDGTRERLGTEPAPAEVAPLVAEIDALVAQNHATVERARAHLGNLAHALKTPVAVLRNALAAPAPDLATARAQAEELDRLVRHHLARARATALPGSARAAEVSPLEVAQEIGRALARLFAEEGVVIEASGDAAARVRVDRQDLAEMLGNLLENACKWATRRVQVAVTAEAGSVGIAVADDGPGLPEDARGAALIRGVRLDETAPGTGLGLAIVADLAGLHGGALTLGRSAGLGGLLAQLTLPGRRAEAAP
ncbi:sensor histidine kinase [Roseicella aquatilis]|uniref:histidine kinase n=1 Tax=Roseicella aquatilis TaxID=2527868 RepID=A0A4R4D460_9PROT|nr:sensor histidine kinase [Roseicella aquatilis]TCZ52617.1 HAMP domain-containing histidine kinase [Roseicella aquatilis]